MALEIGKVPRVRSQGFSAVKELLSLSDVWQDQSPFKMVLRRQEALSFHTDQDVGNARAMRHPPRAIHQEWNQLKEMFQTAELEGIGAIMRWP